MSNEAIFTTADMYVAAFIWARGKPIQVVPSGPRHCRFDFPPDAEADAQDYARGVSFSIATYADCLRRLKKLIANARPGHQSSTHISSGGSINGNGQQSQK